MPRRRTGNVAAALGLARVRPQRAGSAARRRAAARRRLPRRVMRGRCAERRRAVRGRAPGTLPHRERRIRGDRAEARAGRGAHRGAAAPDDGRTRRAGSARAGPRSACACSRAARSRPGATMAAPPCTGPSRTAKGPAEFDRLERLATLDPLLRDVTLANPLIVQAYLNTHDSLNRIWPWIDAASVYDPGMNIPEFNFYYEADARHNPARAVVWTDAYVDPAGKGWLVSAIAPAYRGDLLEAVVGADVTIDRIVDDVLSQHVPWQGFLLLIGKSGTLLALPPQGEELFKLRELTRTRLRERDPGRHVQARGIQRLPAGGPRGDRRAAQGAAVRKRAARRAVAAPGRLGDDSRGRMEAHEPRAGAGGVRAVARAEPRPRGRRLGDARGPGRVLRHVLHVPVSPRARREPPDRGAAPADRAHGASHRRRRLRAGLAASSASANSATRSASCSAWAACSAIPIARARMPRRA